MIEFLLSVWARVVDFFSNIFFSSQWYHTSGHSSLVEYIYNLKAYVADYRYNLYYTLNGYKNKAEQRVEHVIVNNFSKTTYVAVESFPDVQEVRNQHMSPLREFTYTLLSSLRSMAVTNYSWLSLIFSYPLAVVAYILGRGPALLTGYETSERPAILSYVKRKDKVEQLTESSVHSELLKLSSKSANLLTLGDGAVTSPLTDLSKRKDKIFTLVEGTNYTKIVESLNWFEKQKELLSPTNYPALIGIIGMKEKLAKLASGDDFTKIFEFLKDPSESIKAWLHGQMIAFILNELVAWKEEGDKH